MADAASQKRDQLLNLVASTMGDLSDAYAAQQTMIRALVATHPDLISLIAAHGQAMYAALDDCGTLGALRDSKAIQWMQRDQEILLAALNERNRTR